MTLRFYRPARRVARTGGSSAGVRRFGRIDADGIVRVLPR